MSISEVCTRAAVGSHINMPDQAIGENRLNIFKHDFLQEKNPKSTPVLRHKMKLLLPH